MDVERPLERIERLLRVNPDSRSVRTDLGFGRGPGDRWAQMVLAVVRDVDHEGGEVTADRLLEIGEAHGYHHRGITGLLGELLRPGPHRTVRLAPGARRRVRLLRDRLGP
jgi:hypothetical protein